MLKPKSTILITGCGGFVGSHLTEALLSRNHSIIGLDLCFPEYLTSNLSGNFRAITGSVHDDSLVSKLVERADQVIHLAAIASPHAYVKNPKRTIDINLNASIGLIERLRFTGKPIFFASTSEIYGKNPAVPWKEFDSRILGSTSINRWCYSTSKAMVEHYLYACAQEGSISFNGVRIFNCYGPRLRGRVVDRFISDAIARKKLVVHGDGEQTRCFTYISDLISALIVLVESAIKQNKFYNIGNPIEHSVNSLARIICEEQGLDFNSYIEYVPHSSAIGESYEDIPRRVPDCSLALSELGWEPKVHLREGISKMLAYEKTLSTNGSPLTMSSDTDE